MSIPIEQYVHRHALTQPDKTAIISAEGSMSYASLWQEIDRRATTLRASGVKKGQVVFFKASADARFLATYFAIHHIGAVAAPLAHDAPDSLLQALTTRFGGLLTDEGIADVLFTTGTTGRQKGVMLSDKALMGSASNLIQAQGFRKETRFVISGPLNHIGSLSKVWPVMVCGGTLIILQGMRDLSAFLRSFAYPERVMATFLVPDSLHTLLQTGGKGFAAIGSSLDFLETGAAPISRNDMLALCKLFPHTRLFNTYASTETGVISTYNFNDGRCLEGCVGKPIVPGTVTLTPEGTMACSGNTLMSGYLADAELTKSILHDGRLYTNDQAEFTSNGEIVFKGRTGDVINIGGYKVSPLRIEQVARRVEGIDNCICIAARSPIFGKTLKLLYTSSRKEAPDAAGIARQMALSLERHEVPRLIERVENIQLTYNGKPDRKYYLEHER